LITIKKEISESITTEREKQKFRQSLLYPRVSTSEIIQIKVNRSTPVTPSVPQMKVSVMEKTISTSRAPVSKNIEQKQQDQTENNDEPEVIEVEPPIVESPKKSDDKQTKEAETTKSTVVEQPSKNTAKTTRRKKNTKKSESEKPQKKVTKPARTPTVNSKKKTTKKSQTKKAGSPENNDPVVNSLNAVIGANNKNAVPNNKHVEYASGYDTEVPVRSINLFPDMDAVDLPRAELDTTFDEFDLTMSNESDTLATKKVTPGKRGTKRQHPEEPATAPESLYDPIDTALANVIRDMQMNDDDTAIVESVVGIMQSALRKRLETKRRRVELLRQNTLELIENGIAELSASSTRDREELIRNYASKMNQVKSNVINQAKNMKECYLKFQRQISTQMAKHTELIATLDTMKEAFQEKLRNLETRDIVALDKFEKQCHKELQKMDQQIEDLNSRGSPDDMQHRLQEAMRVLSF
jgi:hypothetical protein